MIKSNDLITRESFDDAVINELNNNNNNTIDMRLYPRLDNEDDDGKRIQRALDELNSINGGYLNLEKNTRYYLKNKIEGTNTYIQLYPNISINGNGSTFYVDENSDKEVVMMKCTNIKNAIYKDFTIDTSLVDSYDDGSFRDGMYLRYLTNGNINVHFDNIKFTGWRFQIPLNFTYYYESHGVDFGYNVTVKNCEFSQMSYPSCINGLKYENCTWHVNLDERRVSWLEGHTQTPFKFTAKSGFITGIEFNNCTLNVDGERLPMTVFEAMRCELTISNFKLNNRSSQKFTFNIMSSASKDYGKCNKETKLVMNNCNLEDYSCVYGELANVVFNNCIFGNTNALYSTYNKNNKQTILENGNGKVICNSCTFKDCTSRMSTDSGDAEITLNNCIIEYDRSKSLQNGFNIGNNSSLIINNCVAKINGSGSAYMIVLNNANKLIINGLTFIKGSYDGETSDYTIYCIGTVDTIIINSLNNPYKRKGMPYVRLDGSATIKNREICNEKIILNSNYRDYEIVIENGNLVAKQL